MTDLGRRARFDAVVDEVLVPLQRYLLRRADRGLAEDTLGDVLLVLWRRADDIPAAEPLPWCYAVARRCLANSVRGERRRGRLVARMSVPAPTPAPEDPDLGDALDALSAADRELLRLWAWEQLPPREIAVALGISPNAASIRLHRAIGKLRVELLELVGRKDPGPGGHLTPRQPPRHGTEAMP